MHEKKHGLTVKDYLSNEPEKKVVRNKGKSKDDERNGTSNIFLENGKLPDRIESDVAFGKNEKSAKFFWNNHNIRLDGESSTYDIMKDAHGGMYRRYYAKEKYEA